MIELLELYKSFDDIKAVNHVSLSIRDGEVFGLVGTNGAGKSTILRIIAGVIKPDKGIVCIDNRPVYDNPEVKKDIFFISDDQYFLPNSTPEEMADYYEEIYDKFDKLRFFKLCSGFGLDIKRKISTFSKGMKKQVSILLGICSGTKFLLCDETFDGLDPVVRQGVKSLFAAEMADRGLTPVIASHNLRELEDICDHIGLLHQGGVILSEDLSDMKLKMQKVQCVFAGDGDEERALEGLDILLHDKRGRLHTITMRGEREEIEAAFKRGNPVFFEVLPLSLEEIFISETEVVGYDIRKFILE
ncbi:ABC transporter ATP-binding protein [Butyrivibrio proteoclasticus B316]|jgi:ABC-2 type transport system ATP-binding protein|uniref:ABC transporter ATP-binding protein n=1 Tax=Butyrivibrio proteoclasticus (strain ATCC 51982 / DSM 14932 / B316) TaxID=515622 RepID=E0RWG9_BUTPB|nr:ABC transporter ATP-binding protein [Butyrivibrio proteoclasticus]ADL34343.1 ABC transporter ATP-binding protein [Butyrivibrio proteoclasticus B316]